ncbi:MAG: BatA and WFA domain-containing protein [Planctomycetota bacterium]
MNLVSPERLWWLAIAAPIIILYILRSRLRKQPVATLMFWDKLFDPKRQRSWWQRLRHWLSLLLQLAFLALIVGALIDPLWPGQAERSRQVVLIVDNSASMAVETPAGPTRLEEAIEKAQEIVRELREGDEVALITAGGNVTVEVGMTDFAPAVRDALEVIEQTDGPTMVPEAIGTARRMTRSPDRRDIVVIGDFGQDEIDAWGSAKEENENEAVADSATESGVTQASLSSIKVSQDTNQHGGSTNSVAESGDDLRWFPVGESKNNVAITQMAVRRSLVDPIGYAVRLEVRNFGETDVECRLNLDLDESPIDVIPLSLAADEVWTRTLVDASAEGGRLTATIDVEDALAVDNSAVVILPRRDRIPVTLVTPAPSVYLESVLDAIPLIDVRVTEIAPEAAPRGGFVVLHRCEMSEIPGGAVLVIDPQADSDAWTLGETSSDTLVAEQAVDSPLLPHVRLQNMLVPGARSLELADNMKPLLMDSSGRPLMASRVDGRNRLVVLSANLEEGDLPLRIAFPVMMTNAVNWFLSRTGEVQPSIPTGSRARIELPEIAMKASQTSVDDSGSLTDLGSTDEAIPAVSGDGEETLVSSPVQSSWIWKDPGGNTHPATLDDRGAWVGPANRVGTITLTRSLDLEQNTSASETSSSGDTSKDEPSDDRIVAVNLCDVIESDLQREPVTSTQGGLVAGSGMRSIWFYVTVIALVLIVGEWFLFQRRVVA